MNGVLRICHVEYRVSILISQSIPNSKLEAFQNSDRYRERPVYNPCPSFRPQERYDGRTPR